jgi:hypothetical protein
LEKVCRTTTRQRQVTAHSRPAVKTQTEAATNARQNEPHRIPSHLTNGDAAVTNVDCGPAANPV